jgi:hypothetical protein
MRRKEKKRDKGGKNERKEKKKKIGVCPCFIKAPTNVLFEGSTRYVAGGTRATGEDDNVSAKGGIVIGRFFRWSSRRVVVGDGWREHTEPFPVEGAWLSAWSRGCSIGRRDDHVPRERMTGGCHQSWFGRCRSTWRRMCGGRSGWLIWDEGRELEGNGRGEVVV